MSRIGKKPIEIPGGVKVALSGLEINVQGPKGNLKKNIPAGVNVEVEADQVRVLPPENPRETTAMQGLTVVDHQVSLLTAAQGKRPALVADGHFVLSIYKP